MIRIRVAWVGMSGGPSLTTHFFVGDDNQAAATEARNLVNAFWGVVDNNISSTLSWSIDTTAIVMTAAGVITNAFPVAAGTGQGSDTTEKLPDANQGLIRWETGTFINGRRLRGRTFVPGLTEGWVSAGQLSTTAQTNWNTAAATFAVNGTNASLAIWSRVNSSVSAVDSGSAQLKIAVLRSRRDS
jgi:hypothetical protein